MDTQQPQSASQSEDLTTGTASNITEKPESIHYTQIVPKVQSYLKATADDEPVVLCPDCLECHNSHDTNLDFFADALRMVETKAESINEIYAMQAQLRMAFTEMMVDPEVARMADKDRAEASRKHQDAAESEEERYESAIATTELVAMALREGMELIIEQL